MRHSVLPLSLSLFVSLAGANDAWPVFRCPTGQGLSTATGLPLTWSETEKVKWKTEIHGKAWSSPVVLGNQIWITTASEEGHDLFAIAVDRESGKVLHDLKLFHIDKPQYADRFNS